MPVSRTKVVFEGLLLKDDRVALIEYGLNTGSRVFLVADDQPARPAQAAGGMTGPHAQPAQQPAAPTMRAVPQAGQGPPQPFPSASAQPAAVPGAQPAGAAPPVNGGFASAGAPPMQQQQQSEPAAEPHPDAQALAAVDRVVTRCRTELLPELVQFEQTIAMLPPAPPGTVLGNDAPGPGLVPPKRIPITQRKLSEYFLRELMSLDSVAVDSDEIRISRKAAVKEIQGYLDRVDTAWRAASEEKGIANDI